MSDTFVRTLVPLEDVPIGEKKLVEHCFYCNCFTHPRQRKAVAAIAIQGTNSYYGICGHHAEVYPFTEEERQRCPMRCPDCFPCEVV